MFIEEKDRMEKRKFKRARFPEAVSYQLKDRNDFGGCLACDIGEDGMCLNFNDFVPIDTEVIIQIKLPQNSRVVDVTGRVIWLKQVPYSDRFQVGLQFFKNNLISQEEIRSYVKFHVS